MFPSILIVDDEISILKSLSGLLTDEGFEVTTAVNGYEALKTIDAESPDLVLLDIWMPGMDGIETLQEIKKEHPQVQVVIITGHGTVETAVKATKYGAFDFIEKPLSFDKIIVAINNALNFRKLEEENRYLRKKTLEKHSLTGDSPAIRELIKAIQMAAPSDTSILIIGEHGTGKELVARTIHQLSPRADQPLIDVDCAVIPETRIASELFGHEKGAFKGAITKQRGKFELANTGTLFLDEIGEMSLKTQAKLLRVLQEKQFQRVGGSRVIAADVRVIAATNKDLQQELKQGTFREDLYYRLNVIPIQVPPLRDRIADLPLLVETFLEGCTKDGRHSEKELTPNALEMLCKYHWPGNVRELKNLMERLAIMVESPLIRQHHIPPPYSLNTYALPQGGQTSLFDAGDLETAKAEFEKAFISHKLVQHNHDINQTAKALGIDPDLLKQTLDH